MIKESNMSLSQRLLGAVDLAIEFATLGEYGLEQIDVPALDAGADHCRRERSGPRAAREARTMARRRGCETPLFSGSCSPERLRAAS